MKNQVVAESPGIFYGWVVVGASLLLLFGAFGAQLCFGVFLKPLTDEFGWTRAAVSGAMSVVMAISGLSGIIMGRLTDKYPVRIVIAVGVLVGGLAYFLLSSVSSLWQFYLYFGLGIGICVGSCYTPVNATVSKWFTDKRALALGIALMGITIGQMALSPIISIIIAHSWKTAYIVLAVVVLVFAVPAVVLLGRKPPASVPPAGKSEKTALPGWSAGEAARTAPFWMLMVTGFALSAGFYFVAAHIVTHAIDTGLSATAAALLLTTMSVGGIGGTLLAWPITTKLGNKYTLLVLLAGEGLAMFLFLTTQNQWLLYAISVLFGFSFGAASPVRMSMVPQLFGMKSIGAILGLATFAWSAGGIAGPVLAGLIFDATKSYDIAFAAGGVLLALGCASVYFMGSHRGQAARAPA